MTKQPEGVNCNGCKYHQRCAGAIFGALGFGTKQQYDIATNGTGDDGIPRDYCTAWRNAEGANNE